MEIKPVGFVRRAETGGRAEIEIVPELQDGLYRLSELDRILIPFSLDRSDRVDLKVHPQGDPKDPLVGVFASRSPDRPNRIGATVVRLIKAEKNLLTIEGLDAWEGTPVLDIKPDISGWGPTCPKDRIGQGKD